MPNYRRARTPGATYFFTVVTHHRKGFLTTAPARAALRESIRETRQYLPFEIDAWVLLPEHLHCIWTLPEGDADYSKRWGLIKAGFSKRVRTDHPHSHWLPDGNTKRRDSGFWQRRFWEHEIRDQTDLNQHMDYIHWNPVKHGHVARVQDWPYSTFHRYVRAGAYPLNWACTLSLSDDSNQYGEI